MIGNTLCYAEINDVGNFIQIWGQYVGESGDIWDSFIFVIALNSSRPFGDISLDPNIVCFALQSPASKDRDPSVL